MKTAGNHHKKITTKALKSRISALLAFILLFQTIFSGVEVHAEQPVPASQETAVGQTADAGKTGTSAIVSDDSHEADTLSAPISTDSSATQQDTVGL